MEVAWGFLENFGNDFVPICPEDNNLLVLIFVWVPSCAEWHIFLMYDLFLCDTLLSSHLSLIFADNSKCFNICRWFLSVAEDIEWSYDDCNLKFNIHL